MPVRQCLILTLAVLLWPGGPSADAAESGSGPTHWAFVPPGRAEPPAVKNTRWVRNPIDRFILARLEKESLSPAPEADPATLVRRLSLDLTGLPPSPEEVEAFCRDGRPDAWSRWVERLLASPRFGERWGRHWLDLARYADSEGYQIDSPRPYAYRYRDWVIEAFNRDLPFDQFTIDQLAGDLVPNATVDQKIAVGFHRNTLMNHEDGVDAEEFRCKARVDRVATTGTAWLGLTLGCAECHSHKYDPVSQREFYQLYAFFNHAEEKNISAPSLRDPRAQAQSFAEQSVPPKTFVHVRGDFLRPGEAVTPGVPAALHRFSPRQATADRLDLARWLVRPENPLTARVAVNHLWQHLFGRGLVTTPEDFGLRGEAPTHPQLLDWLATEFVARHWSRKEMIRLIVNSAAYRQSSAARPELALRDSGNRFLARQNRFRLESEIIRDSALAVAGLLNGEIGGPSFHPFLPSDLKALGTAGAFHWVDSTGPERYRRGLYIFAQRTVPYPISITFDQASPVESCPRRETSDTPLQALSLLNHGIFFECAQALGRRMDDDSGSVADRISAAFRLALARSPSRPELDRLRKLWDQGYSTTVAQVLLNLDEFLNRE